jgi:phenylacetate 2-hydroxylase
VPGNLIMGIAYLSTPAGQLIQARAYAEILSAYPNHDAWHACLSEEKIPYITALYKEILRYWSVIPICLPRTSIRDIEWNGVRIPAGTTFYMNAYAADYDATHFATWISLTVRGRRIMGTARGVACAWAVTWQIVSCLLPLCG